MKMRLIKLSPSFVMDALKGRASSFPSNLPGDTELLALTYDISSRQVSAVVRSDSFEDVPESYPIPELNIVYTSGSKRVPESKLARELKLEPTPAEKLQVRASQETFGVEKEFSAEQRELLSFMSEGDHIVIKPVQYLKAEWDEINEVVRSLGGKWVKGDIVSFWVVPLQR
jgi:hypothetical protein